MATLASPVMEAKLAKGPGRVGMLVFGAALLVGLVYAVSHLISDLSGVRTTSWFPFFTLGVALLVALGFEFVNGFHDTANAVATVIYTHSLEPHFAVAWSGTFNFLGVLTSSGAVAFSIVSLLPVELILQVGSKAGLAMVFALLVAAIIWNLGTWYFGLPASSSHTLVGSIIGVGIANQLMAVKTGTSGVDWVQAILVGKSLLISPIVGFICAALLLLLAKKIIPNKKLYEAPSGTEPPPLWIRGLLVLTCTGVAFSRLERRPEGYGPDHADSHRHRSHGLCTESRGPGEGDPGFRCRFQTGGGRFDEIYIEQHRGRRPARRRDRLHSHPGIQANHNAGAAATGE